MEKVSVYKLSNGELIEEREQAVKRQNRINFENGIENVINQEHFCTDEKDAVREFVYLHLSELKNLFSELISE